MEYRDVPDELKEFNFNERFYREYYFSSQNIVSYNSFMEKIDPKLVKEHELFIPGINQDDYTSTTRWVDNNLFGNFEHIRVQKHDRYTPSFSHQHEFFELVYVLSGSFLHYINSQKMTMNSGDICFIPPKTEHTVEIFTDNCIVLNILIKRGTFLNIFLNILRDKSVISAFFLDNIYSADHPGFLLYHTGSDRSIQNCILEMYNEQKENDDFSDRIKVSLTNMQLSIIYMHIMKTLH